MKTEMLSGFYGGLMVIISSTLMLQNKGTHFWSYIFTKLCSICIETHSKYFAHLYDEEIATVVDRDFYVDNCLKSVATEENKR
ncbi:hypothetical protein DPMN_147829 [Dreissena polymorpha]|uniref:Uncharacterized protein n=1 Tax=Dreissena polymorpha TaxID=45954 RepID=A0A9D4J3C5_DREPO|nr:hypothetical protein DPMN_147829 [Dreissena polymorpha]